MELDAVTITSIKIIVQESKSLQLNIGKTDLLALQEHEPLKMNKKTTNEMVM